MAARTKARKRALDVLFESDAREVDALDLLQERISMADPPVNEYTAQLVEGVQEHLGRIDELLTRYAEGWTLERMPAVDRNALRLGIYEVLYVDDVPDAVAVSEALGLVRDLSTDESPAFVNGVLGSIVRNKATLVG
jgi:N utilization substance protein B